MIRNKVEVNTVCMWPGVSCIKSSPPSLTPRRVARSMFICSERTTVASSRQENAVAVEAGGRNGKYKTVHGLDAGTMLREHGRGAESGISFLTRTNNAFL